MIYVIIPNYNGIEHLKTCFDSIRKQSFKEYKVILVDNGSTDDSIQLTENNYPEIIILRKEFNAGFSIAVNMGIKIALKDNMCKYIILLNNDIECTENLFEEMLKGFIEESVGSVACKMLNFFDRKKIDDTGNFIKLIGSPYRRGINEEDLGQYDKPEYIFGACAGAAIYKKEVFDKIGFFDEDFFAYYEDIDFSFRLQLVGFKCYYNPKAVCYHKRGATSGYTSGRQTMLCERNLVALRIKNYPFFLYIKLTPFFIIGRLKRYYDFIVHNGFNVFFNAVKGYILGLFQIPKSLVKRMKIQKLKNVDSKYFRKIFID